MPEKLQALFILLCIAAIIVGACIWFFGYELPAADEQKKAAPFEPAEQPTSANFKP